MLKDSSFEKAVEIYFRRAERRLAEMGSVLQPSRSLSRLRKHGWELRNLNGVLDFVVHDQIEHELAAEIQRQRFEEA